MEETILKEYEPSNLSAEELEKAIEEADRISATLTEWPDVDNYYD